MQKKLYTPRKDMKDVVIQLAEIVDSLFPDQTKQHIDIQDLIDEMKKWGTVDN
jgi:hypothetical protein